MLKKLLVLGLASAVALILGEIAFRYVAPRVGISLDELDRASALLVTGVGQYEPHPYTSFHRPWPARIAGSQMPEAKRHEPCPVPRILCLGGSTTEGGNAKRFAGSYPGQLQLALAEEHGLVTDVLNGGVSGWTTAETLSAYFLDYRDFDPDVVLIHHSINDVDPMTYPQFRSDYSHWRTPLKAWTCAAWEKPIVRTSYLYTWLKRPDQAANCFTLATKNFPDEVLWANGREVTPEGDRTFRRNIESIGRDVEAQGARVALLTMPFVTFGKQETFRHAGMRHNNETLRTTARENGWILVDLEREFDARWTLEQREAMFIDSVHLSLQGNRGKALIIAEVLMESGVVVKHEPRR